LARNYQHSGMAAYADLQEAEFKSEALGYTAVRHQQEVGTGYFDALSVAISSGQSSTTALANSTEAQQFYASSEPNGVHANYAYVTRSTHETRVFEEFAKEAYYARIKEVYKEIEEFARVDDDWL
jgi:isocitrate lyase